MRHPFVHPRLAGALLAALAATASGQAPRGHRVAGSVVDTSGAPVSLAEVRVTGADARRFASMTDRTGHFALDSVPAGRAQLQVRRLGFRPVTRPLMVPDVGGDGRDSTRIVLVAAAAELAGIEVVDSAPEHDAALEGFYARRRTNNFGHYLDRAQLEATHALRPSDALRSIPGILIQPSRRVGNVIRIRNCRPTIWIDGIRIQDAELDEVTSMSDVAAVEVYKSLAGMPQQFIDRSNPCGGILIWSRNH